MRFYVILDVRHRLADAQKSPNSEIEGLIDSDAEKKILSKFYNGDLSEWTKGGHEMRQDEAAGLKEMLDQLIATLGLPYLCLTDFDRGLANSIIKDNRKRSLSDKGRNLEVPLMVRNLSTFALIFF